MKLDNKEAKHFLGWVKVAKVGSVVPLQFASPFPAIDTTGTQVVFCEFHHKGWWKFDLLWHGIKYGEVTAEQVGNELIFESL